MSFISSVKRSLAKFLQRANEPVRQLQERQLVIQAKLLSQLNNDRSSLNDLADVEFSAFSQWGEDGVINWLVSRIEDIPKTFVEFGVEDYREANTRLLTLLENWRGLVMDGSLEHIQNIKSQDIYWRHELTACCGFIDRDNINDLLERNKVTGPIGLLSVDIDGNDYWVWQAIVAVKPSIVVAEFNAVFGDLHAVTVPYRADFQRSKAHYSNLYFGASLPALIQLAAQKGYSFVGTTSTGCNAFFVRDDLKVYLSGALDEAWAYPSSVREARDQDGNLTFVSGENRAKEINHIIVEVPETGERRPLSEFGELYSQEWKSGRRVKF